MVHIQVIAPVEAICEIWATQVGLLGYDGVKAGLDTHHERTYKFYVN